LGEVQIEFLLQEPFGKMSQAQERVFHGLAKKAPAKEEVIEGNAEVVDQMCAVRAMEQIPVISPAGEEKLSLQTGEW
jgi:hypothetical protein